MGIGGQFYNPYVSKIKQFNPDNDPDVFKEYMPLNRGGILIISGMNKIYNRYLISANKRPETWEEYFCVLSDVVNDRLRNINHLAIIILFDRETPTCKNHGKVDARGKKLDPDSPHRSRKNDSDWDNYYANLDFVTLESSPDKLQRLLPLEFDDLFCLRSFKNWMIRKMCAEARDSLQLNPLQSVRFLGQDGCEFTAYGGGDEPGAVALRDFIFSFNFYYKEEDFAIARWAAFINYPVFVESNDLDLIPALGGVVAQRLSHTMTQSEISNYVPSNELILKTVKYTFDINQWRILEQKIALKCKLMNNTNFHWSLFTCVWFTHGNDYIEKIPGFKMERAMDYFAARVKCYFFDEIHMNDLVIGFKIKTTVVREFIENVFAATQPRKPVALDRALVERSIKQTEWFVQYMFAGIAGRKDLFPLDEDCPINPSK